LGANMIVSHHPLIFHGLKSLTGRSETERCISSCIRHGIAVYAAHTNLDHISGGVSHALAHRLGLQQPVVLKPMQGRLRKLVTFCPTAHAAKVREAIFAAGAGQIGRYDSCSFNAEGHGTFRAGEGANPFVGAQGALHQEPETRIESIFPSWLTSRVVAALLEAHPYEEVAYDIYPLENVHPGVGPGVVGSLDQPMTPMDFLTHLKDITGSGMLRYAGMPSGLIRKVALCGGSGSFLIREAAASGADVFVTADLKYHDFFDLPGNMMLVDAGHFETEQFAREILRDILSHKFPNFAVLISSVNTNPVSYL